MRELPRTLPRCGIRTCVTSACRLCQRSSLREPRNSFDRAQDRTYLCFHDGRFAAFGVLVPIDVDPKFVLDTDAGVVAGDDNRALNDRAPREFASKTSED